MQKGSIQVNKLQSIQRNLSKWVCTSFLTLASEPNIYTERFSHEELILG
jgi:hypothetical protein